MYFDPQVKTRPSAEDDVEQRLRAFIDDRAFPCVGAKSALARRSLKLLVARNIGSSWDDLPISHALLAFAKDYRVDPFPFQSLAVIFRDPARLTEEAFETAMWERLQSLSDKDAWLGQDHDPRVSDDAGSPHFSMSFGGEAFFVVGLHPGASRPARRFERSVLVFNPHDQFEQLRAAGRYEGLRKSILERDLALAGTANPMLVRFGQGSAASQYSGRHVAEDWKCPFTARTSRAGDDD